MGLYRDNGNENVNCRSSITCGTWNLIPPKGIDFLLNHFLDQAGQSNSKERSPAGTLNLNNRGFHSKLNCFCLNSSPS